MEYFCLKQQNPKVVLPLGQWFSIFGAQESSREILGMQIPEPYLRPSEPKPLG